MANIFVKYPSVGDAVVGYLATKEVKFIKADTFEPSELPTGQYEMIGVVYWREGSEVYIAYKESATQLWATRYQYKLTGYTLDGTTRSGQLKLYTAASTQQTFTVEYSATTMDELCNILNEFWATVPALVSQHYIAFVEDGAIQIQHDFTFDNQRNNTATSGFALTANFLADFSAIAAMRRKNGHKIGEGAVCNFDRATTYYKQDMSSTAYNPNTDVTSVKRNYPICLPAYLGTSRYQSDHCAFMRSVYGEGEEGWRKFMLSCMSVLPTDYGQNQKLDGLQTTKLLASKVSAFDGTKMCLAADYCYSKGSECIPQGNWYLPTTRELVLLYRNIHYNTTPQRTADLINATLYKMGGNDINNNTNAWSSSRISAHAAWRFYGAIGLFFNGIFLSECNALPVSLYKINK